jgi:hypothetical protein
VDADDVSVLSSVSGEYFRDCDEQSVRGEFSEIGDGSRMGFSQADLCCPKMSAADGVAVNVIPRSSKRSECSPEKNSQDPNGKPPTAWKLNTSRKSSKTFCVDLSGGTRDLSISAGRVILPSREARHGCFRFYNSTTTMPQVLMRQRRMAKVTKKRRLRIVPGHKRDSRHRLFPGIEPRIFGMHQFTRTRITEYSPRPPN